MSRCALISYRAHDIGKHIDKVRPLSFAQFSSLSVRQIHAALDSRNPVAISSTLHLPTAPIAPHLASTSCGGRATRWPGLWQPGLRT